MYMQSTIKSTQQFYMRKCGMCCCAFTRYTAASGLLCSSKLQINVQYILLLLKWGSRNLPSDWLLLCAVSPWKFCYVAFVP